VLLLLSSEFLKSRAVKFFDAVPRCGYTENFYELIEGDRKNYLFGVSLIPLLVGVITIVWFIMLVVFMCTCRYSFLSGRKLHYKEGTIIRIVFLFSTFVVLSSSIMFLTLGGDPFSDAFEHVEGSKENLFEFTNEGIGILQSIRALVGNLTESNQQLQENIAKGVCDDLPQEVSSLLDSISSTIVSSDYRDQLNQLKDFENGMGDIFSPENESDVDDLFEQVEEVISYLKYGGLPSIITSFFLGCGAVLSWMGSKSRAYSLFQRNFILPLFVCVEIISSVTISLLGILLVIFSDLCTGGKDQSPEGSIKMVLDANLQDEVVREALDHYIINGCRTPSPFGGLIETQDALEDISEKVNSVLDIAHQYFESVCKDSSEELNALLTESNTNLIDLNYELQRGLKVTGCENINSMVVTAIHEGTCGSIPTAMWWMFGCFFAVWIGGLFMLATRAACYSSRRHKGLKCDTVDKDTDSRALGTPSTMVSHT